MKKLMIAAAIVCAAAMSQAAGYDWKLNGMEYMETPASYYTGTGYLFADGKQQDVLDAFNQGTELSKLTYLSALGIDEGETPVLSDVFQYGTVGEQNYAFFAAELLEGGQKYLFISEVAHDLNPLTSNGTFQFYTEEASSSTPFAAGKTYAEGGTGWYTAVPEPTSGLLLLLGVAGLALRRRRA